MPGPLAAQVVMWVGFLRACTGGALAASAAFIAPSFALVLAVAVVYAKYQGLAVVQALFHGIAVAVMAIIAVAAYKLARLTNRKDLRLWAISLILGIVTAVTGAEIALLFLAAGLLMTALDAPPRWLRRPDRALSVNLPTAGLIAKALTVTAGSGTLLALGWFFLKAFVTGATAAAGAIAGAVIVLSRQTITDWTGVAIAAAALGLLLKWKIKEPILVALGAAAGLAFQWPF